MIIKIALTLISFIIVAFGQPSYSLLASILAATVGYALFLYVLLDITNFKQRFWTATAWYMACHSVQLYWMTSHPFFYIYAVIVMLSGLAALQFGLFSYWIRRDTILQWRYVIGLSGLWTVFEWLRLFFLSGYSLNQAGIALSSTLYSLQLASIGGVFLLTFFVMFVNLGLLRFWLLGFTTARIVAIATIAIAPYFFGVLHLQWHSQKQSFHHEEISVILMQPLFPVDEIPKFKSAEEARGDVIRKWKVVFQALKKYQNSKIDLIAIPEYFVPYGTYLPVFPLNDVKRAFSNVFESIEQDDFPPLVEPYAIPFKASGGYLVTNAFFAQALSNYFKSDVIVGFEDTEEIAPKKYESYSAAFLFTPDQSIPSRYEKRILVPMGEYIPHKWLRDLAAGYGIQSSFTPGKEAKVFQSKKAYGMSICYEETCGHLVRESRTKGADLFVNLTSDAWFPNSMLPQVHFDHARLRTVENGVPLVRACNTGVTGAIDSLGRIVGILGDDHRDAQTRCDALFLDIPTYHYQTLYSKFGDWFIVTLSFFAILGIFPFKSKNH